jgi:hypothetical protein
MNEVSRRNVLTAIPLAATAAALPATVQATENDAILEVLAELENWEGWEASCVVAAKAYAAYLLRQALGMGQQNSEYARLHLEYQGQGFESYKRSFLYERDVADGKMYCGPKLVSTVAGRLLKYRFFSLD